MPHTSLRPPVFPFFDYSRYAFSLGVAAGGRAWLSGQTAARFDETANAMVVGGSLAEQAAVSFAKQGLILEAGGFGHPDVVKLTDYVTRAGLDQYGTLRAERERLYGSQPPATSTVLVDALLRPDALIETEAVAVRGEAHRFGVGEGLGGVPTARAVRVGDLLICSALLLLDPATGRIVPGRLVDQTAQIYRNAEALLASAGFGMRDVVRTVEFIHPSALADYRDTWRVRAEHLGQPGHAAVAATGIPMSRVADDGALIHVEFTAFRGGGVVVNPGWTRYDRLTYAPAVRAGDSVFLSGQLATDPDSGELIAPGNVVEQARAIYGNIRRVLDAAGPGMDAVVKTTEYITPAGLAAYRDTAAVRRPFFTDPYPAATGVVCRNLLRDGALIEIDCVAIADQGSAT